LGGLDDYFGHYPWLLSEQQQLANQTRLLAALDDQQRQFWRNSLQAQGLSVSLPAKAFITASGSCLLSQIIIKTRWPVTTI
jgi:hypothetical protein